MSRPLLLLTLASVLLTGCTETRVVSNSNDKFASMFGGNKNSSGGWQVERHDIEQKARPRPVYDPNYKGNNNAFGTWKVTTSFEDADARPSDPNAPAPGAWGTSPFAPGR